MNQKEYSWYNWTLILSETWIIIKRGLKGFLLGWWSIRWDKSIPYSSIVAVQFKKAWLLAWYLQITLSWWSEAKWGVFESIKDENTVNFYNNKNKDFEEAKEIIEKYISNKGGNMWNYSNLDEIEKLDWLLKKGIITEDEFNSKKKELLGF